MMKYLKFEFDRSFERRVKTTLVNRYMLQQPIFRPIPDNIKIPTFAICMLFVAQTMALGLTEVHTSSTS